ncbi:MAG: hypothetical protein ACU0C9_09720 [Paracoccaceae bacterium]
MKRLKDAWRRRPILTTGFVLAVVLTGIFAFRSVAMMVYWTDPDHRDQTIQGWMTPRFVAQSWHLPPDVMLEALQVDKMPGRRQALRDIAAAQGISLQELAERIVMAAQMFRDSPK